MMRRPAIAGWLPGSFTPDCGRSGTILPRALGAPPREDHFAIIPRDVVVAREDITVVCERHALQDALVPAGGDVDTAQLARRCLRRFAPEIVDAPAVTREARGVCESFRG